LISFDETVARLCGLFLISLLFVLSQALADPGCFHLTQKASAMVWILGTIGLLAAVGLVTSDWLGPFEHDSDWFGSTDDSGWSFLDLFGGDSSDNSLSE
jgi:hypothetical protein